MARGVVGTIITILLVLVALGGIYYFLIAKSQGSTGYNTSNNFNSILPGQQQRPGQGYQQQGSQYGGRKKRGNKKSTIMTTTGIYLLLGAVIVGYITSKFA